MQLDKTFAAEYWTNSLKVTRADIEHLFSVFLETEHPLSRGELAQRLVELRLKQEADKMRKQLERGQLYQPKATYQVGAELLFPALEYAPGKVVSIRAGNNPEYGTYSVILVEFDKQKPREFAAALQTPHLLNIDEAGGKNGLQLRLPSAAQIMAEHGETIIEILEARLVDEEDAISFADQWFLQSLMPEVNLGHLHLAEAILDLNEGVPLPTAGFLNDLDFAKEAPQATREFALNVALNNDERFDDVGAAGQVLWYLRRFEPEEVQTPPARIVYNRTEYDAAVLTEDMRTMEREIDDEWSPLQPPATAPAAAMLTLIYPHRRVGTLPLTSKVRAMFPTAYESQRIRVTLVDESDGQEFAGWVVHEDRYVYGLWEFYSKHRLPIGGYLTVKRTSDPSKLILSFGGYKPRSEYIRLAQPQGGRLSFANFKRSIGAGYDELMIVGAEDIKGVDAVWKTYADRRRGLVEIMKDLIPELSKLTPQNAVHVKTLYSAVNVLRRTPPGPIFAALVTRDDFEHVGGPYWRLKTGEARN